MHSKIFPTQHKYVNSHHYRNRYICVLRWLLGKSFAKPFFEVLEQIMVARFALFSNQCRKISVSNLILATSNWSKKYHHQEWLRKPDLLRYTKMCDANFLKIKSKAKKFMNSTIFAVYHFNYLHSPYRRFYHFRNRSKTLLLNHDH